jgi:diguanylate cyclase (GGDEF)-like protein
MRRAPASRDFWASLLPVGGATVALSIAWLWPTLAGRPGPVLSWALLPLLLAAAVAACHRPFGVATLGLGAAALAPALVLAGPPAAALVAAGGVLAAELALRLVRRSGSVPLPERRGLLRGLEAAGRAALAALAAGGAWELTAGPRLSARTAAAALAYGLAWLALDVAERKLRRPEQDLNPAALLLPPLPDLAAWAAGGAVVAVARAPAAGWRPAGLLLGALALAALEAARNGVLLDKARRRNHDLERLRRAGRRMISPAREMAAVAARVHTECGRVVPFHWFQFEALASGHELRSWWAGPDRSLHEGMPEPEPYPPALPGVHRRSAWQVVERSLRSDDRLLARLRLWCDPRRLDAEALVLLDRLLPQVTASVEHCLLGREAREDPLTGLALRRVLERRLNEAHARCREDGSAMAVVLCDLDHFKRLNDAHGHAAGDAALVAVAQALKAERRADDLCCRYGGEEFVLLLERTDGEAALVIAERVRRRVEALDFRVGEERVPLTLSAGVACSPEIWVRTAAELLLFADEALYEAKRQGRNRCLLDLGQGRYADAAGVVHVAEDAPPLQEAPRIFA